MNDTYYVQPQARRLLRCMSTKDMQGTVSPTYLSGLDPETFWEAFDQLHAVFSGYYRQAEADPASLSLPAYEIDAHRNTSKEAREGNQALPFLPLTLYALAMAGELQGGLLQVSLPGLKESFRRLKGKYLPRQLNYLAGQGFCFSGWNGKKFDTKAQFTQVEYPDNSALPVVLKALASKLNHYLFTTNGSMNLAFIEPFLTLDPRLLADDSPSLPAKTLEQMQHAVGPGYTPLLQAMVEQFAQRQMHLTFDTLFLKNRLLDRKGKDTLNYIEFGDYRNGREGNEHLSLRLKLRNPGAYIDKVAALAPHLKKSFTETWCGNCMENCSRRIVYHLDGEEKKACGCFFFAFTDPSPQDLGPLFALYDLEQAQRAGK